MGLYINPPEETKEQFLDREGRILQFPKYPPPEEDVLVCLVDNGIFTAAGVVCDQRDWNDFSEYKKDKRKKKWYLVNKSLLPNVTGNDLKRYLPEFA